MAIIGLEIHLELATASKMFCGCPADHFGKLANTQTCPVCLGLPGALPVPNKKAIDWTVLIGLALGCQIPALSKFDRKNYFYPDLPKGYQISQYDAPLAVDGAFAGVRIRRVHLEEDTAKLIHADNTTLINFNRSGVPLVEIVTEPDMTSAIQAKEFLQRLQQIIRYLDVSEADMEKGQMRCEPTINLKIEKGSDIFYTPLVEIKNINSFRFVQKAIDFEISRQTAEFQKSGAVKQPGNKTTRGWHEAKAETFLQREKEEASDYRYFPEPDIPPLHWQPSDVAAIKKLLPELPDVKLTRLMSQYHLPESTTKILATDRHTADYFEKAVAAAGPKVPPVKLANLIVNKKVDIAKTKPDELAKTLASQSNRVVLSDAELAKIADQILAQNSQAVADYQKGKTSVIQYLLGQAMQETHGQADPVILKQALEKLLKNHD